jgi:tetratricopeptide (TPR) repeat protein
MKEDLKSGLINLQRLEFIYEKSLLPELEYIFRHALTQEVAYNGLLLRRRKEIHERVGKALEELYPHRLEEFYEMLAYHYSHSNNQGKACRFLKLSGQKAARSNSHREAFRLFKDALEVLHQMPRTTGNDRDRLEILSAVAVSTPGLGHPEGSLEFLREGEALAKDLGDEKALAAFFSRIGMYYITAGGDPELGKTYIEKGLSASELIGEVEIIAPAVLDLVYSYAVSGDWWKICEVAPKCIELIERTGTQFETFGRVENVYSLLQGNYGMALGGIGNFDMGEHILVDCRKSAHHIGNPLTLAMTGMCHAAFYLTKGDGKKAVEHYKATIELCEKSQFAIFLGMAWAWAGAGYLLLEQPEKALEHLEKGLKIHLDLGIPMWLGSIHAYLAMAHLQLGNLEKALVHAEQGVNLCRANNERLHEAGAEMVLGRVIGAGGSARFDEAREHILRAVKTVEELKLKPSTAVGHFHLGELSASSGRTAEALEHLRRAEAMFRQMGMDYLLGKTQDALAKL